ncbi:MAG: class I adenylate-forming enzyme family protein [Balneolales bacterium]
MAWSIELQKKVANARSLGSCQVLPALPFASLKSLMAERGSSDDTWLIYINAHDNRVELSYRAFYREAVRLAHFLKGRGLKYGDRMATVSYNHWHVAVQYFAAWLIGLVVVPVNPGEDEERIAYILKDAGVKLAFVRVDYQEQVQTILDSDESLKHIQMCICRESLEPFYGKGPLDDLAGDLPAESDALIVYTSGTTGQPKGVLLSQKNLLEDARSISGWHDLNGHSRMMCVLPVHHVNGTVVTLVTPFYAGCSVVLNQKFRARSFFRIISDERVGIVSVVPTLLQFLNNEYKGKANPSCPDLSHVICGAGPLTVQVARQFEDRFHIRIIHGYGLSETTCYSCFLPLDLDEQDHKHWMRDYGYPSIGIPLPANEMQIHDLSGNPLGEGKRGEIVIRGVNVMKEYYGNEEASEKAFTFGWFRSGDEGFFRKDKKNRPFFFITGRLKELIIRGGVNLSPLEIDEVICTAPGVDCGIAVGFENDWYGEEVGAYVKLNTGIKPDGQKILDYCAGKLPFNKTPKAVVFADEIPVTSTGKFQRLKVAARFREWKGVQFKK